MRREIKELLISWFTLSIAFAFYGSRLFNLGEFLYLLPISFAATATGFIFHELAHRYVARKFGCYAEYRLWAPGLVLAFVFPIITLGNLFFAAPGAVFIACNLISRKKEGIIALSGPLANIIVGLAFLFIGFLASPSGYSAELIYGIAHINFFLAAFNLIPFYPLDGSKVFYWNPVVWAILFIFSILMFEFPLNF